MVIKASSNKQDMLIDFSSMGGSTSTFNNAFDHTDSTSDWTYIGVSLI